MAALQGLRTTNQTITTENRLVRVPDKNMMMLEPNNTALVTFLLGMKKRRAIKSPRIEHFEDDYMQRWAVASAQVNANASSTTISVSDGSFIVVGDILMIPSGSSSNHERVRVTAKPSANVCTVVRNIGSTGLLTLASGAGVVVLGQAFEEGSAAAVAKITTPSLVTNYTQIFKKSINITGTDAASEHYADGGNERKRLQKKMGEEFKIQKNYQYMWGVPNEDLTGGPSGNPLRQTGGLYHFISTNRQDAGGLLTKKAFETYSRMAFRYGSKKKMLMASPILCSALSQWGTGFLTLSPSDDTYGVQVSKVKTAHGVWIVTNDWTLEDGVSGQNGLGGYGFSIDMDSIEERYLEGRDTQMELGVQPNDEDRMLDTIMSESGLQVHNEKKHSFLFGITDYEL